VLIGIMVGLEIPQLPQDFDTMFSGPSPVDVENDRFRIHNPLDVTDLPVRVLLAALGPVMLRIAGERADGTVLWMADERAIADHVLPRITKAAAAAGRPAPRVVAGVAVCLCAADEVDAARERANRLLGHAEYSPNYHRLLEQGDADDVGDMAALGTEADIERRLRSYADAGTTDFSARILPMGNGRDELVASSRRTREFLASLGPEFT
jgi:alkanesulfonate monooxygenase SsuD/methylene tetrahydromethanopterin reductase-like flavin-dependent oxidoreductase (luciferase family)